MNFLKSLLFTVLSLIISFSAQAQEKNIAAQFSVFPGLSTNGLEAKSFSNNLSFNLFAGHNGGVQGFELGSFVNIVENEVYGMQIAGITNIVQGEVKALQVGGIFNYNAKNFQGLQASGIANVAMNEFMGLQVSGIFNSADTVFGGQITGIAGIAKNVYGLQISGLGANANSVTGLQVSGIINKSREIKGAQIAGLVNVTDKLTGTQIGLINISRDARNGVPIGFISFSRNGYKTLDVYTSEIFPATLSLKTGVNSFYNVFLASSNFEYDEHLWSMGYGLGSRFHMTRNTLMEFELTASHLSKNLLTDELNLLGRFNLNVAFQFGSLGEFYFGPSANIYLSQVYNSDSEEFGYDIAPKHMFYNEVTYEFDKPTLVQGWIGGQIGLRL